MMLNEIVYEKQKEPIPCGAVIIVCFGELL